MEKVEIVGVRHLDFTDNSGRAVKGTSFYFLMQRDGVDGQVADKLFVSDQRLFNCGYVPKVGDVVFVSYDRYGKASDFKLAK